MLVVALAAAPALSDHHLERYAIAVEGMSCSAACPPAVEGALGKIEGVTAVEVDFSAKQALVTIKQGAGLDVKACNKAFANSGYFATGIEKLADRPSGEGPS